MPVIYADHTASAEVQGLCMNALSLFTSTPRPAARLHIRIYHNNLIPEPSFGPRQVTAAGNTLFYPAAGGSSESSACGLFVNRMLKQTCSA